MNRFYARFLLCSGSALACLATSGAVLAQAPVSEAEPATAQPEGIADIVVTAQRRTESVQKTSLNIQVLGSQYLERQGFTKVTDLTGSVPGLQIAPGGNQAQAFIRGVGSFNSVALGQSAVGFNIDGVHIADGSSVTPLFYDLARVEVLKGPQGTLYGRNASAGAINIITNRPSLSGLSGSGTVEFGNYDAVRFTGAVNVPLSETVAIRAAGQYLDRDAYMKDGSDDDHQEAVRLQMYFEPSESFNLLISGDIEHREGVGPGSVYRGVSGLPKFSGVVNAAGIDALITRAGPFFGPRIFVPGQGQPPTQTFPINPGAAFSAAQRLASQDSVLNNTQRNISAEANYDFGPVVATFSAAYRTADNLLNGYGGSLPFLNQEETRQQTYEFRLAHDSSALKAVVGIYYFNYETDVFASPYLAADSVLFPTFIVETTTLQTTKSIAGFAQFTYSLTDALRLTAGARYTNEKKNFVGNSFYPQSGETQRFDTSNSFNNFSYRAGVEFDVAPANMLYATVSRGFKAGGFNAYQPAPGQTNAYDPETLTSYTAGLRNRFFDNRVQFNVEGFYWEVKGSQQNQFGFTNQVPPAFTFLTVNAASATLYGVDADLVVKVGRGGTFAANAGYVHSKFNDFINSIPTAAFTPGSSGCAISTPASTPGFTQIDCSGFSLPRAPKWSGSVSYTQNFDLGDDSSFELNGEMQWASKRFIGIEYLASELAPSYQLFNASGTYTLPGGKFSITGFIRNIANKEVEVGGVGAAFSPGITIATVQPPRTYGMRLSANW